MFAPPVFGRRGSCVALCVGYAGAPSLALFQSFIATLDDPAELARCRAQQGPSLEG